MGCVGRQSQPVHFLIGEMIFPFRFAMTGGTWMGGSTDPDNENTYRGLSNGFLGFDIEARRAKVYDSGDEHWTGTKLPTIGLAVARLFKTPEKVKNRFIYIYSTRTSQNEILRAFETATGKKWDVEHVKFDDEVAAGQELMKQGNRLGIVPLILSSFFREKMGADFTRATEADNDILGLPVENVEDVVREVLAWPESMIESARLV